MTSRGYNAANQISDIGFVYDANGNLTSDAVNAYSWDRANRLLSMGGASYGYDGDASLTGNCIRQTVGTNVTQYLLDVQPGLSVVLVAAQGAGQNATTTRYVHEPLGIHAHMDAANNWEWPLQDGLGSVRGVADNSAVGLLAASIGAYIIAVSVRNTMQPLFQPLQMSRLPAAHHAAHSSVSAVV